MALRQLVIATDAADVGLATWRTVLDQIGTPYDVVLATTTQIDQTTLVRPDGVGRYDAVLLASSALWLPENGGAFRSALTPESWNALWECERTFGVRQAALSTSPGTSPEDYCMRPSSEGSVGNNPVAANVAPAGAPLFDRLKAGAPIPIIDAYVYRATVAPGCPAQPVLTIGSDVVGVLSTAPDGRERMGITMALPAAQTAMNLLAYGIVRWATRGVFLGEERNWLAVDVDDWFLPTLRQKTDGSTEAFRLTWPEARSSADQQHALRKRHPLAGDFTLTWRSTPALHQGNLHEYAPGRSLTFDWLDAVLTRYDAYYSVAPENPDWPTLAAYVTDRTSHFACLAAGNDAVWDRSANTLTFTPALDGTLFVTGLATSGNGAPSDARADLAEKYGSDTISRVRLSGGQPVAYTTGASS